MMGSLYTGIMGMKVHDQGLAVVANNLANVNTPAFKQQQWLFQDMMYQNLSLGTSNTVVSNQVGMGVSQVTSRTFFGQSGFEPGAQVTDLALGGRGFFQVEAKNGEKFLTRAGNFIFDKTGTVVDPTGSALLAYPIDWQGTGGEGALKPLQLDINAANSMFSPAVITSKIEATFNLGMNSSSVNYYEKVKVPDPTPEDPDATKEVSEIKDPYFAMLHKWDATQEKPIAGASFAQPLSVYDSNGKRHDLTLTVDLATNANGQKTMEYVLSMPPREDTREGMLDANGNPTQHAGLLMSGTLTFSGSGQLSTLSAFTPTAGSDFGDLANWKPSALDAEGVPIVSVAFPGAEPQNISLNLGAKAASGWTNPNVTAADIGANRSLLPTIGVPPELESFASTSHAGNSSIKQYIQNGAAQGDLADLQIKEDGMVVGHFSNGKSHELYRIPIFRVGSEDGLRREGNNHFSTTLDSGVLEDGTAGTENYGKVLSNNLETSNVDMSKEMVHMIILQRGFQSNSKSITTSDQMLQKALELKR